MLITNRVNNAVLFVKKETCLLPEYLCVHVTYRWLTTHVLQWNGVEQNNFIKLHRARQPCCGPTSAMARQLKLRFESALLQTLWRRNVHTVK